MDMLFYIQIDRCEYKCFNNLHSEIIKRSINIACVNSGWVKSEYPLDNSHLPSRAYVENLPEFLIEEIF